MSALSARTAVPQTPRHLLDTGLGLSVRCVNIQANPGSKSGATGSLTKQQFPARANRALDRAGGLAHSGADAMKGI